MFIYLSFRILGCLLGRAIWALVLHAARPSLTIFCAGANTSIDTACEHNGDVTAVITDLCFSPQVGETRCIMAGVIVLMIFFFFKVVTCNGRRLATFSRRTRCTRGSSGPPPTPPFISSIVAQREAVQPMPSHLVFSIPVVRITHEILVSLHGAAQQRSEALHAGLHELQQTRSTAFAGGIRIHGSLLKDHDSTVAESGAFKKALQRNAAIEGALMALVQLLRRASEDAFRQALAQHAEVLSDGNILSLALRCARSKDARSVVRAGCGVIQRSWRVSPDGEKTTSAALQADSHHQGLMHLRSPPRKCKPKCQLISTVPDRSSLYLTSSMPIFAAEPQPTLESVMSLMEPFRELEPARGRDATDASECSRLGVAWTSKGAHKGHEGARQGARPMPGSNASAQPFLEVRVDAQVEAGVLAPAYWRRSQLQRGFDMISAAAGRLVPSTVDAVETVDAVAAMDSVPDQKMQLVECDPANARTLEQSDERRFFRTWTHAATIWAGVARKARSAEAWCTFARLARGLGCWRAWTDRGHVALGAAYHAQQAASSLAFLRWVRWATEALEASARSAILVSLFRSSRLLKVWQRLLRGVDVERRRGRELHQRMQSLHHAWTRWMGACATSPGTPQTSCASPLLARGTPPGIPQTSCASPLLARGTPPGIPPAMDQAADQASNMDSGAEKDPSDMPSCVPTPCTGTGHFRAAEVSPSAAEAQPASSPSLLERLAAIKAAVRGPTPARVPDTSSSTSSSLESSQPIEESEPTVSREELVAQLKEARFAAQMGETDLEKEGGRARVRLLQAQLAE